MTATNMCSNFGDFRCHPPTGKGLSNWFGLGELVVRHWSGSGL